MTYILIALFASAAFVITVSILGYWYKMVAYAQAFAFFLLYCSLRLGTLIYERFKKRPLFEDHEEFYHNDHKKSF